MLIALVGIWSVAKRKAREEFFRTAKNSFAQQALRNTELFCPGLFPASNLDSLKKAINKTPVGGDLGFQEPGPSGKRGPLDNGGQAAKRQKVQQQRQQHQHKKQNKSPFPNKQNQSHQNQQQQVNNNNRKSQKQNKQKKSAQQQSKNKQKGGGKGSKA